MKKTVRAEWVTNSYRVYFDTRLSNIEKDEVREWCRKNCGDSWKVFPQHVRFFNEADSVLFHVAHA